MEKKRLLGVFAFAAFAFMLLVMLSGFASARYFGDVRSFTQDVIDSYVEIGEPILSALFGGYGGWSGFLLFERLLLFILLVSLIYISTGKAEFFEEQKAVRWVVAIIVPLIAIRFIDFDWLTAIITQYKMVFIIFACVLPFALFFFFVHGLAGNYPILRQIMWAFFIAIYAGLWTTATEGIVSQIYAYTMVAAALALVFDKRIENYLRFREMMAGDRNAKWREIGNINTEIQTLEKQGRTGAIPQKIADAEIKKLTEHKTKLAKSM